MGLLAQAEKHELLKKLTEEKKQYADTLHPEEKHVVEAEITAARAPVAAVHLAPEATQPKAASSPVIIAPAAAAAPNATSTPAPSNPSAPVTLPPQQFTWTGIPGFDKLMDKGIPRGSATLICGGPGSGKTIFCLNTLINSAKKGEKCLYMSFEEKPERLRQHMHDFGWNPEELEANGTLTIRRYDPYELTRSVEALLEKSKGELLIDVAPIVFPMDFKPDKVIVDSLSSIASAFYQKEDSYRIYVEQLFKLFEAMQVTSFFISELSENMLGTGGSAVEQFLADNVVIIYNIKKQNVRESAIEILKLRGATFQKRIVAMQIINGVGVQVYPEQKVYGGM